MEQPNNNITPEVKPENPLFKTTDKSSQLSQLIGDLGNPKQEFEQPAQEPFKKDNFLDDPPKPGEPSKTEISDKQNYKNVGKTYVTTIDTPLILGATLVSGKYDPSLKLDPGVKEQLIEAWADLAEAYGWEKPPAWLAILATTGGAYGTIFYKAWNIRTERKKTAAAEARATVAEKKIAELQKIIEKNNIPDPPKRNKK